MIIYKITNKINNKAYIGQTSEDIKTRFNRHMGYQALEHDTKFYRAVRKYGRDNFYIEQIDSATSQEELDEKEVQWIIKLDTVNNGYNSHANKGKSGGDTLSNHPNLEEIKKKLSDSKMGGANPNARKIKAINIIDNKEYYYDSYADCVRDLGLLNHACISGRCLGKIKSPYKKQWLFEYND